jgi:dTDP-4-amino-4,6-dideoxygalactose transaminase
MAVPMLDLKKQYSLLREQIRAEIDKVLDSQMLVRPAAGKTSPQQAALEDSLREYCGAAEAICCSSGTDALLVALMAMGIGPGDEVICPSFTFFATAGAVARLGAKPVFVDIDERTFNISPKAIENAISDRTRAIIPVHLYGQMADMQAIMAIADKRRISVLEDAAQAIGAKQNDRPAGSFGKAGALSFYPTKNLNALGDAGAVVTTDAEFGQLVRLLCVHGDAGGYNHVRLGANFRMDEIQAAALNVKFPHLEEWHAARRAHAAIYDKELAGVDGVVTPLVAPDQQSIYNQYVIRAQRRAELIEHLRDRDIGSAVYYPKGLHEQPCFAYLGYRRGDLPVTEQACREVLALPVCPEISDLQVMEVAQAVKGFYQPAKSAAAQRYPRAR